ncbi:AAA family ATPase [Merismopedia glauca]|uniref:AAA family ATPase n=1 Tax=Merismopedia glauca CCAP 1448/3 TaxID=1296344 RepID=A0A2T1C501_9CYAN|nr:AAA family ATPase [Merismopedia glauca]PSB03331.1 AAA family ATPase [Merismopedia glauca CCAP 1448/3]
MSSNSFGGSEPVNLPNRGLLGSGWRPLNREIDWGYLSHLVFNDTWEITQKSFAFLSNLADAVGRHQYAWWANVFHLFSDDTRYNVDTFWNYITPEPPTPDYRYPEVLSTQTPIVQNVSRDSIPIDYVLNKLQETTVKNVLAILGKPDLIIQYYWERYFYLPIEKFSSWERVETLGTVYAYWSKADIWLTIEIFDRNQKQYTLTAKELTPLINKATYNLAVILSGYKSRVGQVQSQFSLRAFPSNIQSFSDLVQQSILDENQLAVLVHGEPGTGKTAWTQAVAKEILMPLGYVIFILDHDAVENFVPPAYIERICIIINEADNLAQDRASLAAQSNNKTEHILSLLDGTLYQSVIDESDLQKQQKLVVLMTCNTTERLDPALLRKGRIDLISEFTHKFV